MRSDSRRSEKADLSEAFMKVGKKSCLLLEVILSRLHRRIRLSSSGAGDKKILHLMEIMR